MKTTTNPTPTFAQADDVVDEIKERFSPSQRGALGTLFSALHAEGGEAELAATIKVLSIGLFVLGLDRAGDYCLAKLTDTLHGERSDEAFNAIVGAGGTAGDARREAEVEERRAYPKTEEARA